MERGSRGRADSWCGWIGDTALAVSMWRRVRSATRRMQMVKVDFGEIFVPAVRSWAGKTDSLLGWVYPAQLASLDVKYEVLLLIPKSVKESN